MPSKNETDIQPRSNILLDCNGPSLTKINTKITLRKLTKSNIQHDKNTHNHTKPKLMSIFRRKISQCYQSICNKFAKIILASFTRFRSKRSHFKRQKEVAQNNNSLQAQCDTTKLRFPKIIPSFHPNFHPKKHQTWHKKKQD